MFGRETLVDSVVVLLFAGVEIFEVTMTLVGNVGSVVLFASGFTPVAPGTEMDAFPELLKVLSASAVAGTSSTTISVRFADL